MTPRQEAFAQAYTDPSDPDLFGNASACYRRHYTTDGWTDNAIWVAACRVLQNAKVSLRINDLMAERNEAANVSVENLTRELMIEAGMAREKGQHAAAISAVMGMAKIHGLLAEDRKNERSPLKDVLSRIERENGSKPRLVAVK